MLQVSHRSMEAPGGSEGGWGWACWRAALGRLRLQSLGARMRKAYVCHAGDVGFLTSI